MTKHRTAAGFKAALLARVERAERRTAAATLIIVQEVERSIKYGSEITGAPGQPVDTSTLLNSWRVKWLSKFKAVISTAIVYARGIEDGVGPRGPITLRSKVGGFHSVKITKAKYKKIVAYAAARARKVM